MVRFGVKFDHWVSNVAPSPKFSDCLVMSATSGSGTGNSSSSVELSEAFVSAALASVPPRELAESGTDLAESPRDGQRVTRGGHTFQGRPTAVERKRCSNA